MAIMSYDRAELQRKLANVIQITVITRVDHANKKLRVRLGADESGWLEWPAYIGRNFVAWKPLRVGQQVIISCVDGDPAQAVIIGDLYSRLIDAPSTSPLIDLIQFNDGCFIKHTEGGELHIHASRRLILSAPQVDISGWTR